MGLHEIAARLAAAGTGVSAVATDLPRADPGAAAFGADATGRLGDLARDLHRCCVAALDARAREARTGGARLAEIADAVGRAGEAYDDADHAARARAPEWRRD